MSALDALRYPEHDWRLALAAAEAAGDERPTWAYRWPAGERFAADLPELCPLAGRRVCDLGCGQGRLGLRALLAGAEVVFADASEHPLAYLAALLRANDLRAHCVQQRWGDPIPGAPFDLILGGDILYRPECFSELLASIASGLAPTGEALLSDPRHELEPELPELAATAGLAWTSGRRERGYTLARLNRSLLGTVAER